MYDGIPAGLLALGGASSGVAGGTPGFAGAFGGALQAFGQAEQQQAAAQAAELQRTLQLAQAEQQIRAQELAAQERAQQQQEEEAQRQALAQMVQSAPEDQQALASAFPKIYARQAAQAQFRDPNKDRYKVVGTDIFDVSGEKPVLAARGRRTGEPLEQIFDPETGQVSYVPRSQAAGKLAPPKQGITVGPDGTIQIGGTPNVGLHKKTAASVERDMIDLNEKVSRLAEIGNRFDPSYLELGTRISQTFAGLKDKVGLLDPAEQQSLADYAGFKQSAFQDLNQTLKELSGAAVTPQEAARQLQVLPNPGEGVFDGDAPSVFKRKLDNSVSFAKKAYARLNHILRNGLDPGQNFAGIKLDDMPKIIDKRGKEIEAEIKAREPDLPDATIQQMVMRQLSQEYGL